MNFDKIVEGLDRVPDRFRWLIIVSVAVAIVLVYYIVFRLPAEEKLQGLKRNYVKIEQDFAEKQAIANDLKDWEAQVHKLAGQLQEALSQLPEKIGYDTLIIAVPNIAKKNGLSMLSFDLLSERPKGDYNEVPIKLSLTGPYLGLGRFIQEIGEHPRIMKIGDLEIKKTTQSGKKGDGSGDVTIDAELVTYRFAAPAAAAKPAGGKR